MCKLYTWLNVHKLSLNMDKCNYILFINRRSNSKDLFLEINNFAVKHVDHMEFLGVVTDEKFKWSYHITMVKNKTSVCIGVMHKARKSLPNNVLLTQYYLIHHSLTYCTEVWGSAASVHIELYRSILLD